MTPEQKQLEQIEGRLAAHKQEIAKYRNYEWAKGDALHYYEAPDDVDFLLSLVKSQEAGSDLQSRDDVLKFFGASLKENGDLSIDMKKYHAAHLCQEHSFEPWRRNEIEDKCVMCLARDRENAATEMRSACVEKVNEFDGWEWCKCSDCRADAQSHAIDAHASLSNLAKELESLSIEKPKE